MRIIHFYELTFSSSEMSRISEAEYSVIVLLTAAADELRVFENFMVQVEGELPDEEVIQSVARVYFFVVFRTYLSKILEADALLKKCTSELRRESSSLVSALSVHSEELRAVRKSEYFHLSKKVRDKSSSHFDLPTVRNAVRHLDFRGPLHFRINKSNLNTFYSFGDAIMMHSVLDDFFDAAGEGIKELSRLREWSEWAMKFSKIYSRTLEALIIELCESRFQGKQLRKNFYYLDEKFGYDLEKPRMPLFAF